MKPIKEQLQGTCVLNEKEGMGAEIVALYTEAGIENDEALVGDCIGEYYGVKKINENTVFNYSIY
jgi:hypothetical protein